jgi:DNA-binding transcriptional LysR family regulator
LNRLQVEYAIALARYKNFTEAARNVYVTQPAFSKQISSLEKELGFPLFIRTSRSIELTPAGETMIAAYKNMQTQFEQAYHQAILQAGHQKQHLNIGFLKELGNHPIITSVMDKLIHTYPSAEFKFGAIGSTDIAFSLESDENDIIITLDIETKLYSNVNSFPLYKTDLAIIISSAHPLAKNRYFDFEAFHQYKLPVLVTKDVVAYENFFDKSCQIFGVDRSSLMVVSNIESMLSGVEAGLGVAYFSTTPRIITNPAIRYFILENEETGVDAMWKTDNPNPLIQTFIQLVQVDIKKKDKSS